MGGEYRLVGGNLGAALIMTLLLKVYIWPLIALIIHIVLVQMAKKEPDMRIIYMQYAKQGDRYEPWTEADPAAGFRPIVLVRTKDLL